MMLRNIPHQVYYLVELGVLVSGFFLIVLLSFNFLLQLMTLLIVLILYSALGIFHHKLHHALHAKIVVEYILISGVIFASFLFLTISSL